MSRIFGSFLILILISRFNKTKVISLYKKGYRNYRITFTNFTFNKNKIQSFY